MAKLATILSLEETQKRQIWMNLDIRKAYTDSPDSSIISTRMNICEAQCARFTSWPGCHNDLATIPPSVYADPKDSLRLSLRLNILTLRHSKCTRRNFRHLRISDHLRDGTPRLGLHRLLLILDRFCRMCQLPEGNVDGIGTRKVDCADSALRPR